MKIYVDADACPRAIRDILTRAATRREILIYFVANQPIPFEKSKVTSMITVTAGPDIADDRIVELVEAGDLVISEDIPLADRIVTKGGFVISPHGEIFTTENIKSRLATRDLLSELRDMGIDTGGQAQFSQKDTRMFANQLDRFLTKNSS